MSEVDFLGTLADLVAERVIAKMQQPADDRVLLSLREASTMMGCPPSGVRYRIGNGTIPESCVARIGGRVFLRRANLVRWMEAK